MNGASLKRILLTMTAITGLSAFAIAGCGKDSNPTTPPATADVTIEIVANAGSSSFAPNPQVVAVGQTVSWHNADVTTHTATADGGAFNSGNIAAGATSTPITMTTAGGFAYHCAIHPSMVGSLTVNP